MPSEERAWRTIGLAEHLAVLKAQPACRKFRIRFVPERVNSREHFVDRHARDLHVHADDGSIAKFGREES